MDSEVEMGAMDLAQLRTALGRSQRAANRHARLNGITRMLGPTMRPEEVASCFREGLKVAGADGGFAAIRDPDSGQESIIALGISGTNRAIAPIAAAAMAGEELFFSTTHDAGERFPILLDTPLSGEGGSLACLPLVAFGRTVGGCVLSYSTPQDFADDDRRFLQTLAGLLAQSVSLAHRVAGLQSEAANNAVAARRAKALSDASRFMTEPARPLADILADLVRVACDLLGDGCMIRTTTSDGKCLVARVVQHRTPLAEVMLRRVVGDPVPVDFGELGRILRTGEPVVRSNPDLSSLIASYPVLAEFIQRFPISSFMIVPLQARDRIFGVISVARHEGRIYDDEDLHFLENLADRAALSIDHARLREQLQHSERQLRVALDAAHLGAWEWDIGAQRVSWSPTLEEIHGIPVGSFSGTFEAYQSDVHPEDRERVLAAIRRIVEQRVDHHVCYRIVRPDGEVRWLETHGKLMLDSSGNPERLVGVCSDVTERRKSEEQLRETLLALQDSDHRKDQFLAMLAHELRNPLGPMLNATHLLGMPDLSSDIAGRARQILERQVQHMCRLLDDLLDVSQISRGKIELKCEPVDLVALTHEVLSDHGEAIRIAGLHFMIKDPDEPILLHADRTRLAQIIANTVSNAIKFSDRGAVHVNLTLDRARAVAAISIRDEGIGVEPSVLARMFEPFEQVDGSLARGRGGLGLGLAVVKGLVALHGGWVTATSEGRDRGTELRIELPLERSMTPPSEPLPPTGHPTEAMRVLVFEDNLDAAESLRVILSDVGHRVEVENTGARALEVIRSFRPEVVLCDLGLPEKDGYAIAAEVRSDKTFSGLLLIAISGYGALEDQVRSKRAGFDLHFTKPVPPLLVLSAIAKSRRE